VSFASCGDQRRDDPSRAGKGAGPQAKPKAAYGRFLVVEDEEHARRTLVRIVSRYRPVRQAAEYGSAVRELRAHRDWCGLFFDVSLGRRALAGLELLDLATTEFPGVPVAIVTGRIDPVVVNRAAAASATVVSKPLGEGELMPFLQRVVAREHGFTKDFAQNFDAVSRAWKLSPREHEILAWLVAGGTREGYLEFAGMEPNTLKTHVKHMLGKTKMTNLAELVSAALRRVVVADGTSLDAIVDERKKRS
jgi:FixJ family two-component response regulator